VHIWCCGTAALPLPAQNPNDLAVELMGIEPTASRVRFLAKMALSPIKTIA
jgi:hypothetical protein